MDVLANDYTNTANLSFQYHAEAYKSYMGNMGNHSYSQESIKSIDISFSLDISYSTKEELMAQLKEIDDVIEEMVEESEAFLGIKDFFQPQDTAQRLIQNILDKAQGDPLLVRSGREGLIQGYQDMFTQYNKYILEEFIIQGVHMKRKPRVKL